MSKIADFKNRRLREKLTTNGVGETVFAKEKTELQNSADEVKQAAADTVNNIANATSELENTASDTANDIANATEELKEVAKEIKKPSAARKSSNSKRTSKPKSNSKK